MMTLGANLTASRRGHGEHDDCVVLADVCMTGLSWNALFCIDRISIIIDFSETGHLREEVLCPPIQVLCKICQPHLAWHWTFISSFTF